MNARIKNRIKQVLSSHPDSIIYYHEDNEWSIYPSVSIKTNIQYPEMTGSELLEGNDFHNKKGYAPELVVALAELLGITVRSNGRIS